MLASYAGADGLKTGYTNASGFNLVMSAVRDNRRLIGVVMGGNTAFQRDRLMAELMDQGFVTAQAQAMSRLDLAARAAVGALHGGEFRARHRRAGRGSRQRVTKAEPAAQPRRGALAVAALRARAEHRRKLGDPGRLVQRFARRPGGARARHRRAAGADPLAWRGDGRRGAGLREDPAPRRLTNLSQQEAVDGCKRLSQHKITARRSTSPRAERRPDPGEKRPLVAPLPGDEIPFAAGRLKTLLARR
jgi:hypothetical protein